MRNFEFHVGDRVEWKRPTGSSATYGTIIEDRDDGKLAVQWNDGAIGFVYPYYIVKSDAKTKVEGVDASSISSSTFATFTLGPGDVERLGSSILNIHTDPVTHPNHYQIPLPQSKYYDHHVEVIDIIHAVYPDDYNMGNVVKYVLRAPTKGNELQDLKKARMYLDWAIKAMEAE